MVYSRLDLSLNIFLALSDAPSYLVKFISKSEAVLFIFLTLEIPSISRRVSMISIISVSSIVPDNYFFFMRLNSIYCSLALRYYYLFSLQ